MSKIKKLAGAIKKIEGWFPIGSKNHLLGSLTYRHHNPGALRWSPTQCASKRNFAVFEDDIKGMAALIWDITMKANGRTRTRLTGNSTIEEFCKVWAPASDNNNPNAYANKIEKISGIKKSTKLKELL